MARARWCGPEIYDVALRLVETCLRDGSLFSTERAIWTLDLAQALDGRVGAPIEGKGSFVETSSSTFSSSRRATRRAIPRPSSSSGSRPSFEGPTRRSGATSPPSRPARWRSGTAPVASPSSREGCARRRDPRRQPRRDLPVLLFARGSTTVRVSAPGRIRTCDFCLRRAALYPLSYGRGGGGAASGHPTRPNG